MAVSHRDETHEREMADPDYARCYRALVGAGYEHWEAARIATYAVYGPD